MGKQKEELVCYELCEQCKNENKNKCKEQHGKSLIYEEKVNGKKIIHRPIIYYCPKYKSK